MCLCASCLKRSRRDCEQREQASTKRRGRTGIKQNQSKSYVGERWREAEIKPSKKKGKKENPKTLDFDKVNKPISRNSEFGDSFEKKKKTHQREEEEQGDGMEANRGAIR